jgi:hypothetical protein
MLISEHTTPIDVLDFVVFPGDPDWDAVRQTFNLQREDGVPVLHAAVDELPRSTSRLELARALLALGGARCDARAGPATPANPCAGPWSSPIAAGPTGSRRRSAPRSTPPGRGLAPPPCRGPRVSRPPSAGSRTWPPTGAATRRSPRRCT